MTPAEQARLAADWATILQSEWAGLAADREIHDALHRAARRLAQQAALLHAWPPAGAAPGGPSDDPSRPAGADAPPGPTAADAALGPAGTAVPADGAAGIGAAGGVAPNLG